MRELSVAAAVIASTIAGVPATAYAQPAREGRAAEALLDFWPVRAGIYVLVGDGGNVVASVGPDGLLLVNTGTERSSPTLVAALQRLRERLVYGGAVEVADGRGDAAQRARVPAEGQVRDRSVRYIVNTGPRPEHIGGNAALVAAMAPENGITVIAHENVLVRLVSAKIPFERLPTYTIPGGRFDLSGALSGEGIRLAHLPAASTDGDLLVHFRRADVICTGAVFSMETFPVIDIGRGGTIDGSIRALNYILSVAIPGSNLDGGTVIIPGAGRVADSADVGRYRDMLAIIRDQVQQLIDDGMTLEQVKAARPTLGFEGRYGAASGAWTTDMFVEAVYRSLAEAP